ARWSSADARSGREGDGSGTWGRLSGPISRHPQSRSLGPNAAGKSSASVVVLCAPDAPITITRSFGANSKSTCRHAPHGMSAPSRLVTIARSVNSRAPSETALTIAVRSAHHVMPKLAFSTLHPEKTRPSRARNAAPTRTLEYGLYAWVSASFARATRSASGSERAFVVVVFFGGMRVRFSAAAPLVNRTVHRDLAVALGALVSEVRNAHAHLASAGDRILALLGHDLHARLEIREVVRVDLELAAHVESERCEHLLDAEDAALAPREGVP